MDLDIKEVSSTLNVNEQTLLQWVEEGKIPSYVIGGTHRFNHEEVEDWILENLQKTKSQEAGHKGQQSFNLLRAFRKGAVFTDIQGTDKETIIRNTTQRIAPKLHLDPEVLSEVILERENLMPTALGKGFGIPHARDFYLTDHQDMICVTFLDKPIDYGALDGEPVHTLLFLLACDNKRHLSLLAKIAHLISDATMREALSQRPSKLRLLELIKNWETTILEGTAKIG
jgi:PTS system nitrogen regulatory IIA component